MKNQNNKSPQTLGISIIFVFITMFLFSRCCHSQDTLNILYKNEIPSEYKMTYNPNNGVQAILYVEQEHPMDITMYTKNRIKEAYEYVESNYVRINGEWISYDSKYKLAILSNNDYLLFIKQKNYINN